MALVTPSQSYLIEDVDGNPRFLRAGTTRLRSTDPEVQRNPQFWELADAPGAEDTDRKPGRGVGKGE